MVQENWKYLKSFITAFGLLVLIFDSDLARESAGAGIELCIKTVIPSLLPFFVLSMLLRSALESCNFGILEKITTYFKIPTGASSVLIPAILGGYPVGAMCVGNLYQEKMLSREEAERLLSFCNNAGPAFLFGMLSVFFPERKMVWSLWLIHLFSAAMTAKAMSREVSTCSEKPALPKKQETEVILPAAKAMCMVCCWVILLRILISFLKTWFLWIFPVWVQVVLMGFLELTNGCCALLLIPDVRLRFVICSCMLSFGGICVLLQTASVTEGLSLRSYLTGKIVQTVLSLLLSCAIITGKSVLLAGFISAFVMIFRKIQNRYRNPKRIPV